MCSFHKLSSYVIENKPAIFRLCLSHIKNSFEAIDSTIMQAYTHCLYLAYWWRQHVFPNHNMIAAQAAYIIAHFPQHQLACDCMT